ncbi:DNA polymerase B exonuclease domain family protein [Babesia bovis T2Bo]|uniref:DNA polymerase epsilon catalytic subunit n=1 Tax=Babesia bovis TaxID=5865 RepID=A7API1_BABBO|nr:DNA polymerase B exonuclease domain family protein [Babesia bovis T2Bo]EDO08465.1 DNA polymerase B exonuclease domain family protein [Babesia bovis T2Bo]|eukprot:XP_001612033.1 DNA polymerase family B, exonuclease domain containing protein [Babesia bovis T2Bo]
MDRVHRSPRWSTLGMRSGFLYNVVPCTVPNSVCVTQSGRLSDINTGSGRVAGSTLKSTTSDSDKVSRTALSVYFVSEDCTEWHTTVLYAPYFYISVLDSSVVDQLIDFLNQKFASKGVGPTLLEHCTRVDLSLPNHIERLDPLTGKPIHATRHLIKASFNTIDQLERARSVLQNLRRTKDKHNEDNVLESYNTSLPQGLTSLNTQYVNDDIDTVHRADHGNSPRGTETQYPEDAVDRSQQIVQHLGDIYEHDVKYITRVCIDLGIRCGTWYDVERTHHGVDFKALDKSTMPPLNVFAWDIECYKAPLKFPDMETDEIILISAMFNGQGYLIVNRSVVARDISEFRYHPCDEMSGAGAFRVYNEPGEKELLQRFFKLVVSLAPHIIVTYNGDVFDFPYVRRRAEINGLSMDKSLGMYMTGSDIITGNAMINMDCYRWVERDSYLPFGSRTLKQVCKIKLKYNPTELDPEEMVPCARNDPQTLAVYSVSDAVATYYLYMKYIHSFIFALCYIVPLQPNDVLRQGSGTLCESLLMAEAYSNQVLFPNKHKQSGIRYFKDPVTSKHHLIYDNSYIGARVASLRCGLFRDDLKERFELKSSAYQELIDDLDQCLNAWADGNGVDKGTGEPPDTTSADFTSLAPEWLRRRFSNFENFDEVYTTIRERLVKLRDQPVINTFPRIYHLDVGAMYPNIIISQRLQPTAVVTEEFCQKCSYYSESNVCQKRMQWKQKLEISPVDRNHILPLMKDLESRTYRGTVQYSTRDQTNRDSDASSDESDSLEPEYPRVKMRTWKQLTEREQASELQKVIKSYSQKVFNKMKVTRELDVESIVCQRENPFYLFTVQKFRDKRYVYKRLKKEAENGLKELLKNPVGHSVEIKEMRDRILVSDSLQLAHKCILNSFYGYVKRGGSRWYSMEMGAIVTYAGAEIIDAAHKLIRDVGIPIELDTDGIWCMLPDIFPAVVDLKCKGSNKTLELEYMTTVLNRLIERQWTNDQYLEMEDIGKYRRVRRNEILFELDGPWHAMFLPASEKSEDLLKKRYVVFNHNKQIVELKGFEIKRRGEMRMIQLLQEEIFPKYLLGVTKEDAYRHAASIGLGYRTSLDMHATNMDDDDMFDLLVARKTVKQPVSKQPNSKCFGITTAKRLAELFKDDSYINDGNLCMSFLLVSHPSEAPRTARAIPIQSFMVEPGLRAQCLARWLKIQLSTALNSGVRDILDWDYYREKLDTQMLKLVCIPAVLQGLDNPLPMIQLPPWLKKRKEATDTRQKDITSFFTVGIKPKKEPLKLPGGTLDKSKVNPMVTCDSSIANTQPTTPKSWIQELKKQWIILAKDFQRHRKKLQKDVDNRIYVDIKRGMLESGLKGTVSGGEHVDISVLYMLMTERWHLYSCELDVHNPGIMNCVISVHNKPIFANFRVELWRVIYINCLKEWEAQSNENITVRPVTERYILPRGATQKSMFELEMRESYFLSHVRNTLGSIFHKTLLGVYESQVPIEFDFATRLGNVIHVQCTEAAAAISGTGMFKSRALQGVTSIQTVEMRYLDDVEIVFLHIFHGMNPEGTRRNRVFAAVYHKGSKYTNHIFVGGSTSNFPRADADFDLGLKSATEKQGARYDRHESIKHEHYRNPDRFPDCFGQGYERHFEFSSTAHVGCRNALRSLDTYMRSLYPQSSQRKYIVFAYSTLEKRDIGEWALGQRIPVHWDNDLSGNLHLLPTNGYISASINASLNLLYQHRMELEYKMSLSRIASLPLGNIISMTTVDCNKYLMDVMYARALRSSSALLWGTGEAGCDLGIQHGNDLLAMEYDITSQECSFTMSSNGIYRGYGAKIGFNHSMMYNAIMFESRVSDVSLVAGCDLKKAGIDARPEELQHEFRMAHASEFHPLAFCVLGSMLDNLIKLSNGLYEQVEYGTFQRLINLCAFIRPWLSDPRSVLYDPGLYSRALRCTQQYISSFLNYIESRHHLRTVYVTQTYVVVDADVLSVTKGRHKVHVALEAMGKSDSRFRNIPFYIDEEYVAQIQLSTDCYIRYKNYVDATYENCTESLRALEYLPGAVEMFMRYFFKTVALDPLWKTLSEFYDYDMDDDNSGTITSEPVELLDRDNSELKKQLECHVVRDWLQPGSFFSKMYELLEDDDSFLTTFDSQGTFGRLEFPKLPGSTIANSSTWRLETVKMVSHVLRIDRAVDWNDLSKVTAFDEKRFLMFTLAGDSEYSVGEWYPPIQRLELSSVCCRHCSMVFNLEVVSTFISDELESGEVDHYWRCELCSSRLDNRDVEVSLIRFLENLFCAYQSQDLVCRDCKSIKQLHLSRMCTCGGQFVPRLIDQRWHDSFSVMSQLAKAADMLHLQEVLLAYNDMW